MPEILWVSPQAGHDRRWSSGYCPKSKSNQNLVKSTQREAHPPRWSTLRPQPIRLSWARSGLETPDPARRGCRRGLALHLRPISTLRPRFRSPRRRETSAPVLRAQWEVEPPSLIPRSEYQFIPKCPHRHAMKRSPCAAGSAATDDEPLECDGCGTVIRPTDPRWSCFPCD